MDATGGPVRVPATIRGVGEALPEAERVQFTTEIENTRPVSPNGVGPVGDEHSHRVRRR